jgi:acetylglutamate/LysW-gamma-L-alpha-aminoadipate kinase
LVIVVKVGGRALASNMENLARSVAARSGMGIVFVHGGGGLVTEYSERMGIRPTIVTSPSGIRSRYTDERELEVYTMVMAGKINKELTSAMQRFGAKAVGISGVDGGLLVAERKKRIVVIDERGRKRVIPGGYTGSIRRVNEGLLRILLDAGYTPVVAPLALGLEGELLNVDGDQAAASIAVALRAEQLVMLSDVEGVILNGRVVERFTASEAHQATQSIGPGMNRKLMLAADAARSGVGLVRIANGLGEDPLDCLDGGRGTVVVQD